MKQRTSSAELKQLLVDTGKRILIEEGLGSGAEGLTLKRVLDRVDSDTGHRYTNASVLGRLWERSADYQAEVLAAITADETSEEIDETIAAAEAVLVDADLLSEQGRRRALQELCRVAGGAHARALSASRTWHLFIAIWGLSASQIDPDLDGPVATTALRTYQTVTARLADILAGFIAIFSLQLRAGYTLEQLALSVVSLSEGCALRDRIDPRSTRTISRPTGPAEEAQEWTLFAIGLEALVLQFTELRA